MKDIAMELEELGIKPKISQEQAEEQWRKVAREYRIVGEKADSFSGHKRDMIVGIMCGDLQVEEVAGGVAIRQFVAHPGPGCPGEILYNPPGPRQIAAGGTDVATATTRWVRVAAALSGQTEGALTLWLTGHDHSVMESIVQLFTSA